jgi:hypothetical protein
MIRTVIETPREQPGGHSAELLHEQLARSATGADRLQHANIQVLADCVVFTLFLRADDRIDAAAHAEQLCRRTMASVSASGGWRVRATSAGP